MLGIPVGVEGQFFTPEEEPVMDKQKSHEEAEVEKG